MIAPGGVHAVGRCTPKAVTGTAGTAQSARAQPPSVSDGQRAPIAEWPRAVRRSDRARCAAGRARGGPVGPGPRSGGRRGRQRDGRAGVRSSDTDGCLGPAGGRARPRCHALRIASAARSTREHSACVDTANDSRGALDAVRRSGGGMGSGAKDRVRSCRDRPVDRHPRGLPLAPCPPAAHASVRPDALGLAPRRRRSPSMTAWTWPRSATTGSWPHTPAPSSPPAATSTVHGLGRLASTGTTAASPRSTSGPSCRSWSSSMTATATARCTRTCGSSWSGWRHGQGRRPAGL